MGSQVKKKVGPVEEAKPPVQSWSQRHAFAILMASFGLLLLVMVLLEALGE